MCMDIQNLVRHEKQALDIENSIESMVRYI